MVSGPDTSKLPSRRIAGFNLGIQFSFLLELDNNIIELLIGKQIRADPFYAQLADILS